MSLLLDTHALLWALSNPSSLTPRARSALADAQNRVAVSAASVWEIAIKRALGKLDVTANFVEAIGASRFDPLPITLEHAEAAGALPTHHADPFDRMLVAQARAEGLTIVTRDSKLARYDVAVMSA